MIKRCPICRETFETKRQDQVVCSTECAIIWADKLSKGGVVKQKCVVCGKEFKSLGKARYCSLECRKQDFEKHVEQKRREDRAKPQDHLTRTLEYCKRVGITYAEYQKLQTMKLLEKGKKK